MSWFTVPAPLPSVPVGQPPCPRCKTPEFVARIKRSDEFDIFDCRRCGAIDPKRAA